MAPSHVVYTCTALGHHVTSVSKQVLSDYNTYIYIPWISSSTLPWLRDPPVTVGAIVDAVEATSTTVRGSDRRSTLSGL